MRHDARTFARCKGIAETRARRPAFLRWTIKAPAYFLGTPLVGLALLGRIDALAEEACFRLHLPLLLVPLRTARARRA